MLAHGLSTTNQFEELNVASILPPKEAGSTFKNWLITTGNDISDEAKITGITPAVFTFRGILEF